MMFTLSLGKVWLQTKGCLINTYKVIYKGLGVCFAHATIFGGLG